MAVLRRGCGELVGRRDRRRVESGNTILFGGYVDGVLMGTVQLSSRCSAQPAASGRRAETAGAQGKSRRQGVAAALMAALETTARERRLSLLTLEPAPGTPAERFYGESRDSSKTGIIPATRSTRMARSATRRFSGSRSPERQRRIRELYARTRRHLLAGLSRPAEPRGLCWRQHSRDRPRRAALHAADAARPESRFRCG